MKILLLCKKFPYPLKDGESIAIHNLSQALTAQGCQVSILAMNTKKHFFKGDQIPEAMSHYHQVDTVEIDNRIKATAAFKNLFSSESYHISRFVSADFTNKLEKILQQNSFDVVQLETLYLAPYIPSIRKYSDAIVSMRAHNVEHEIWERISSHTTNIMKRWYLRHLTEKLKRFEVTSLNLYDLIIPITQRDLNRFQKMGCKTKAIVTPIGVSPKIHSPQKGPQSYSKKSISFIGSLDWMPNIEGLDWFIKKVWPGIQNAYPDIELHIAGRNTPQHLIDLNLPNVFVHGEVPESAPFIDAHPMMVVPLLSGSGMRAKILEGMALGKIVLTTTIGLEGISATNKKEVIVANTPDQFVDSLKYIFKSQQRQEQIAEQAKAFVFTKYDNIEVGKLLYEAYASQLLIEVV